MPWFRTLLDSIRMHEHGMIVKRVPHGTAEWRVHKAWLRWLAKKGTPSRIFGCFGSNLHL